PEALPGMLKHVAEGAKAAGRPDPSREVACRIMILVDEDEGLIRTEMRRVLTPYAKVPTYNQFFREIGFDREAEEAMRAWTAGDRRKAVGAISERMIESIFVFGSGAQCRERLKAYAAGGVTAATLLFISLAPTPEERRRKIFAAMEQIAPG